MQVNYFIINFLTRFPGVSIPKHLLEKYQEEMTIAIQYQYKSLVVEGEAFKISLSFGGKYEKLLIPYKAVTSFADPSMNFALKFSMNYGDLDESSSDLDNEQNHANKDSAVDLSAKVISIDAFRKNRINNSSDNQ